jgi:hypothetical protein
MTARKYTIDDAMGGGPGLDGYAYSADIYCEACGEALIEQVFELKPEMDELEFNDSEECPQPIFFGESDGPQHCGACGRYLYGEDEAEETEEA